MFPYDPQLLSVLKGTAPNNIGAVENQLRALDQLLRINDGLKWFNWLYLSITEAVHASVAGGKWNDPDFIQQLDVSFAMRYFDSLQSYLSQQPCPCCWAVLFERRADVMIARVQFAVAGVNGHINHDLPQALVATSRRMGKILSHGGPEYSDYVGLNVTLDSVITTAENALKIRLGGDQISDIANLEKRVAAWSVSAAREAAWTNGEVLANLEPFPSLSGRYLSTLDGLAELASTALLVPVA